MGCLKIQEPVCLAGRICHKGQMFGTAILQNVEHGSEGPSWNVAHGGKASRPGTGKRGGYSLKALAIPRPACNARQRPRHTLLSRPSCRKLSRLLQHRLRRLFLSIRWILVLLQDRLHHQPQLGPHRFPHIPIHRIACP